VIWDALIAGCARHGVQWVRIPFEEFAPASRERMTARRMEWAFFRTLRTRCLRSLRRAGLRAADSVYGHLETGRMSEGYLLSLLPRIGEGVTEAYFHPGTRHATPLANPAGSPDELMDVEMHALLSPRVRDEITAQGFRLSNYAGCLDEPTPAATAVRVE
jgi:hypothetical protein